MQRFSIMYSPVRAACHEVPHAQMMMRGAAMMRCR